MEDNQLKACRDSFEKWAEYNKYNLMSAFGSGYSRYVDEQTAALWSAWQVAYNRPQANTEADELHTRTIANLCDSYKHLNDKYHAALELESRLKIATDALRDIVENYDYSIHDATLYAETARQALSQIQQEKL